MFGIFKPTGLEDKMIKPFMVQLAPLHRVFHALSGTAECSILLEQAGESPTLTVSLISSQCIARLAVCGNSGHFTLSNEASTDKHFHVNAIELLKSDLVEDCGYSN